MEMWTHLPFSRVAWPILLFVLIGIGCNDAEGFRMDRLQWERQSWDSLHVQPLFVLDERMKAPVEIRPDLVQVTLFDASYDTLYSGQAGIIPLQDIELGDAERVLMEVCGFYGERVACDQENVEASEKRAIVEYNVTFPQGDHGYERAFVDSRVRLERRQFGEDSWERITPANRKEIWVDAFLPAQESSHIRLPVARSEQRFILTRYGGYRDFRYAIQSSMLDVDSALVRFDLYVGLSDNLEPVATQEIVLRQKSSSEREAEMRLLVEVGGAQVLDAVSGFFGTRRAYVFVNDWSYQALDRVYQATFELHWQDGFRGAWSDMTGEMHVRADGMLGTYTLRRASERAQERWDERVGTLVLELEPLFPELSMDPSQEDSTLRDNEKTGNRR